MLIVSGLMLAGLGALLYVLQHYPGLRIGRLPGDFSYEGERFRFYFPFTSMLFGSLFLSGLMWLLAWWFHK